MTYGRLSRIRRNLKYTHSYLQDIIDDAPMFLSAIATAAMLLGISIGIITILRVFTR